MLSRICEEFGCLPTRALWELEHDPEQWVLQILPLRAYARAKDLVDRTKDSNDLPRSPLIEQVLETTFELKREVFERRKLEAAERAARKQAAKAGRHV